MARFFVEEKSNPIFFKPVRGKMLLEKYGNKCVVWVEQKGCVIIMKIEYSKEGEAQQPC